MAEHQLKHLGRRIGLILDISKGKIVSFRLIGIVAYIYIKVFRGNLRTVRIVVDGGAVVTKRSGGSPVSHDSRSADLDIRIHSEKTDFRIRGILIRLIHEVKKYDKSLTIGKIQRLNVLRDKGAAVIGNETGNGIALLLHGHKTVVIRVGVNAIELLIAGKSCKGERKARENGRYSFHNVHFFTEFRIYNLQDAIILRKIRINLQIYGKQLFLRAHAVLRKLYGYMSMSEERILAKECSEGKDKAREELYRRYSARLLSLCLRYSDSRAEAEDCMHDAFVRILESIRKYKYNGEGSLYSWMARVTINHCFDSARKRRRIRASMARLEDLPEQMEPQEDGGEEKRAESVPPERLRRMVEELPEAYRTVFKLYAVDGMSHKEIGKLLKIKERTSSSNYYRARQILERKVREYYESIR